MKKFYLLTKTLLVAALLMIGANAWAGEKTVVKYSFDDASSPSLTAGSRVSFDYSRTSVITSTKFLNAWNNTNGDPGSSTVSLGSEDLSNETWTLTFEWAACGGCNSKADHTTLKAGETNLFDLSGNSNWNTTVTITYTGSDGTKTLPVPGCDKGKRFTVAVGDQYNTTAYWHHIVVTGSAEGVKMTITNSSTGAAVVENVVLSETNVNPTSLLIEPCCGGAIGLDELSLTYYVAGEVVQTPVANYTAVNGIERTITATCETEGATIQYSTDGVNYTVGAAVTVSASGNVYFKAVKNDSESDVLTFAAVAGEAITLNAPSIVRSNNTTVTITANQENLLLSPTATITYEYGNEKGSFTGSKVVTVAADATITAYAEATGYATSATSELAVALFPTNVEAIENTPAKTAGWSANAFSTETKTVSERTYAALLLDEVQWGTNVYLQTDGAWGLRASGSWYINSDKEASWILMPNMKAGDIIVANADYAACDMVNATYSKYSYGNRHAYEVTADGDIELAFMKVNASTMDYLYGIYAYRTVTSVPATITSAGWATCCRTYPLDFTGSGLKAYIVTGATGNTLNLTQVTSVPANTAVLLEGAAGNYDISVVASADAVEGNKLVGVTANKEIAAEAGYVLMGSPSVGFYKNNNAFTVGANTAYLPANFAGGGEARGAYFFDGATGVEAVEAASEVVAKEGKFIVDGKLRIFSKGKMFNANGQLVK